MLEHEGHSCVRLGESDPVVIDPGVFADLPVALAGVRHILVTHDHVDHLAVEPVLGAVAAGAEVHGPASVVEHLVGAGAPADRVHLVTSGDRLAVGGLDVEVLGEWHAPLHRSIPRTANVGYLVAGALLHPGDAFVDLGGRPTPDTVLVPVAAPWLLMADVIDWVRALAPRHVVAIHDAFASQTGRDFWTRQIEQMCEVVPTWLAPGERVRIG